MLKIVKRKPEVEVEKLEETKEESKMKNVFKGWSLKKKVLVGAGVLATAVVGVFAYGQMKPEDEVALQDQESYENREDGEDDYDDEEMKELIEMENEEAAKETE